MFGPLLYIAANAAVVVVVVVVAVVVDVVSSPIGAIKRTPISTFSKTMITIMITMTQTNVQMPPGMLLILVIV